MGEAARGISRWRPSDGKGKVVGLYICTMRRYASSQYRQVLLRAPTASLCYISSPTTASTFALACCDDFCQRRAKLYLTYCKRAFGKPQSGKSTQQARANAYFFRRSVACWQFLGKTPYIICFASAPVFSGCTTRAFGTHFTKALSQEITTHTHICRRIQIGDSLISKYKVCS